MVAFITYRLSKEAQVSEMEYTQKSVKQQQTLDVPLEPGDISLFAKYVDADGVIRYDVNSHGTGDAIYEALKRAGTLDSSGRVKETQPDFLADIKRGLTLIEMDKAEEEQVKSANGQRNRQATEEAYQRFLADPAARVHFGYNSPLRNYVESVLGVELASPAGYWPGDHAEFLAEANRRRDQDERDKKEAADAKEEAKLDYIESFMETSAPPEMLAQHKDGLLSREDALTAIADQEFSKLGLEEWKPVICRDSNCACGRKDVTHLPQAAYVKFREIKRKLPADRKVELEFERVRECGRNGADYDSEPLAPVYGVTVKLPVGPFLFERFVKIG